MDSAKALTDGGDTVWYRADFFDIVLGQDATLAPDPHEGSLYVYATSDLKAARAYAAIREDQQKMRRSVYRIKPIGQLFYDPDYLKFPELFIRSVSATLEEVIEARPTMSPGEAIKYLSTYCQWPNDGSPMHDDEGYPTASPEMRQAGIGADALRHLGKYERPEVIGHRAENLVADQGRKNQNA